MNRRYIILLSMVVVTFLGCSDDEEKTLYDSYEYLNNSIDKNFFRLSTNLDSENLSLNSYNTKANYRVYIPKKQKTNSEKKTAIKTVDGKVISYIHSHEFRSTSDLRLALNKTTNDLKQKFGNIDCYVDENFLMSQYACSKNIGNNTIMYLTGITTAVSKPYMALAFYHSEYYSFRK